MNPLQQLAAIGGINPNEVLKAVSETPSHCLDCSRPMVKAQTKKEDRPKGHVFHNGRGLCCGCMNRRRRNKDELPPMIRNNQHKCVKCGVRMVPGSVKGDLPDDVKRHYAKGECSKCYDRSRWNNIEVRERLMDRAEKRFKACSVCERPYKSHSTDYYGRPTVVHIGSVRRNECRSCCNRLRRKRLRDGKVSESS